MPSSRIAMLEGFSSAPRRGGPRRFTRGRTLSSYDTFDYGAPPPRRMPPRAEAPSRGALYPPVYRAQPGDFSDYGRAPARRKAAKKASPAKRKYLACARKCSGKTRAGYTKCVRACVRPTRRKARR